MGGLRRALRFERSLPCPRGLLSDRGGRWSACLCWTPRTRFGPLAPFPSGRGRWPYPISHRPFDGTPSQGGTRQHRRALLGAGYRHDLRCRRRHSSRLPGSYPFTRCPSPGTRLPGRHHLATQDILGRPRPPCRGRHEARPRGVDREPGMHWFEPPDIHPSEPRPRDRSVSEVLLFDGHHRILDAGILVHPDILHIHHGRSVDCHVVNHAWTAPASPPWTMNEAGWPPPRHTWFSPSEGDPGDQGAPNTYTHTCRRGSEEGHQGRGVDWPCHDWPGRPGPEAVHGDPAPVVEWRPAPGQAGHPSPAVVGI